MSSSQTIGIHMITCRIFLQYDLRHADWRMLNEELERLVESFVLPPILDRGFIADFMSFIHMDSRLFIAMRSLGPLREGRLPVIVKTWGSWFSFLWRIFSG